MLRYLVYFFISKNVSFDVFFCNLDFVNNTLILRRLDFNLDFNLDFLHNQRHRQQHQQD